MEEKNLFFQTKMDTCWSRLARLREVWENGTCKNDSPKKVVAVACKELVAYGKFCLWFFESKCFGFLLMYSATAADRLREVVTNEDSALLYDYWWVMYRRWHYGATKRTEATQKKILRQILKLGITRRELNNEIAHTCTQSQFKISSKFWAGLFKVGLR